MYCVFGTDGDGEGVVGGVDSGGADMALCGGGVCCGGKDVSAYAAEGGFRTCAFKYSGRNKSCRCLGKDNEICKRLAVYRRRKCKTNFLVCKQLFCCSVGLCNISVLVQVIGVRGKPVADLGGVEIVGSCGKRDVSHIEYFTRGKCFKLFLSRH